MKQDPNPVALSSSTNIKTTLVIPDIHLRHAKVDKIIGYERCDNVLFLGDHFDAFGDDAARNKKAAAWVKARQAEHPEDIWLWGNHDLAYGFSTRTVCCSGWDPDKDLEINNVLERANWDKFKFFHYLGPWLCSHAGLHPFWVEEVKPEDYKEYLVLESEKAVKAASANQAHWMFAAGRARGGPSRYGGLTWLDFNQEFRILPGVNQVFGHTCMAYNIGMNPVEPGTANSVPLNSMNYNLDTNNLFYGVWNGTELKIRYAPDNIKEWEKIK